MSVATTSSRVEQLVERVASNSVRVDRAAGILRGVKVLGYESANGRTYSREAIARARGLYEGRAVNVDHPARPNDPRGLASRFGRLVNVVVESDGLYADLEYLKSHALANVVCEAAERMPGNLGLSHNADGRTVRRGGKTIVEEIKSVRSVDLVSDPATTSGLFESRGHTRTDTQSFLEAALSEADTSDPQPETEFDVGGTSGDATMDARAFTAKLECVFQGAVAAIMARADLSADEQLERIDALLKTQEKAIATLADAFGGTAPAVEHFRGSLRRNHRRRDELVEACHLKHNGPDLSARGFLSAVTR